MLIYTPSSVRSAGFHHFFSVIFFWRLMSFLLPPFFCHFVFFLLPFLERMASLFPLFSISKTFAAKEIYRHPFIAKKRTFLSMFFFSHFRSIPFTRSFLHSSNNRKMKHAIVCCCCCYCCCGCCCCCWTSPIRAALVCFFSFFSGLVPCFG